MESSRDKLQKYVIKNGVLFKQFCDCSNADNAIQAQTNDISYPRKYKTFV